MNVWLKKLSTPYIFSPLGLITVMDFTLGVLDFSRGHCLSGLLAWGLMTFTIFINRYILEKRARLTRRIDFQPLDSHEEQNMSMTIEELKAASNKATANLNRVMAALGAVYLNDGHSVKIRIDEYTYAITPNSIYKCIEKSDGELEIKSSTCLQIHAMPPPEMIASTLLLLHNDPTIFDRWHRQDGPYL